MTKFGYLNQQIEVVGPKERQIVLQDAYTIRGVVLKPVEGAKVSGFVDADVASPPRYSVTTDADGKFEYIGASKPVISLAAVDENGQTGTLAGASSRTNVNIIQMVSSTIVKLKIKDPLGNPIPDAEVILGSWNKSGAVQLTDQSNNVGEVIWAKAPAGTLVIAARKPDSRTAWAIINTNDSTTASMNLYPPLAFACTAVDSETGERIMDFIVTRRYERTVSRQLDGEKYPKGSLPDLFRNRGILGDRSKGGTVTFVSDYSFDKMKLQIHADGFQTLEDVVVSDAE